MHPHILFLLLVVSSPVLQNGAEKKLPYEERTVEGFTVLVNKEVLAHDKEAKEALKELRSQLRKITKVLPAQPLKKLRKVRIWVEWEKKKRGAAEYHPSAGWLKKNGYPPEKVHCVEINNVRHFVQWSRRTQPWMVLHELAHAYHFQVLGGDHAGIKAAYKQAAERKLYESVPFVHGGKRKAYALTNAKEYFAEISEAYFGKNDFYPYTRDELREHDPVGFRVLEQVWGGKKTKSE